MKKWIAFLLAISLVVGSFSVFAEENSTYQGLVSVEDEFVMRLLFYEGITPEQVEAYMDDVDDFIKSMKENIFEVDMDTYFITIILQVMQQVENLPVMIAFDEMFPDEIVYMLTNRKVPEVMHPFMELAMRRKVIIEVPPTGPVGTHEPEPTPEPTQEPEAPKCRSFDDMQDFEYAWDAVDKLEEQGYLNGTAERQFSPALSITREEFTKLLISVFLDTNEIYQKDFIKEPKGDWYEPYIASSEYYGLSFGYFNWPYDLEKPITREEMVTMAYRTARRANLKLPDINYPTQFDDIALIKYYAVEPIAEFQKANIISGVGNNKFDPHGQTSRADAALIIYKLFRIKTGEK